MGLLTPVYGGFNFIVQCAISTILLMESVIEASVINSSVASLCSSRLESDVSNEECPPPSTPSKEMKRIKLLLDIRISPGGSRVVNVSSKNVMDVPPASIFARLMSYIAIHMLRVTGTAKRILSWLHSTVIGNELGSSESPSMNGCRKTKSPKRRISQYKRLLAVPFRILGIGENYRSEDFALTMPESHESEMNNSRSHMAEKRKRSDDEENSPNRSSEVASDDENIPSCQRKMACMEEPVDEIDEDEELVETPVDSANGQTPISTSLTHQLLDIQEEYESEEDPDYEAPHDESSSSSSSSEDENDSDDEQEVDLLLEDASKDVAELQPQLADLEEASIDDPPEVPENDENPGDQIHHNLNEYTNGQASVSELLSRNPHIRHINQNGSQYSSPFSNLPSDRSIRNSPRSPPSDGSPNNSF